MTEADHVDNTRFLIGLAEQLQDNWQPGHSDRFPPDLQAQLALLEQMAELNKCVYSLFDFEKHQYIFHTRNLFSIIGLPPNQTNARWDPSYLRLIEDWKPIERFLALREQVLSNLSAEEKVGFRSTTCGAHVLNLKGKRIRGCYQARALTFDKSGNVKLSFDSVSDVKELMVNESGHWMRFAAGDKVYHWHSHTEQLVAKDIVSPREIEFINLWKSGLSVPEIAKRVCVSNYTVKNQLANARRRMLARDNTSLVRLFSVFGLSDY